MGKVYKKRFLLILENTFILNLTLLSLTTMYIRANGGNQATLVYTAVGTAFVQFVAIVFYHVLMKRELRQLMQSSIWSLIKTKQQTKGTLTVKLSTLVARTMCEPTLWVLLCCPTLFDSGACRCQYWVPQATILMRVWSVYLVETVPECYQTCSSIIMHTYWYGGLQPRIAAVLDPD